MNNSKRIADDLRALISEGGLVDDQLPTENSLMAKYRASRYAVRKATEELQKQGIIYKVQGGGTFVNKA
nr:GntR family transcriptional regulator [Lacticaseibacillus rhamnosus]